MMLVEAVSRLNAMTELCLAGDIQSTNATTLFGEGWWLDMA